MSDPKERPIHPGQVPIGDPTSPDKLPPPDRSNDEPEKAPPPDVPGTRRRHDDSPRPATDGRVR